MKKPGRRAVKRVQIPMMLLAKNLSPFRCFEVDTIQLSKIFELLTYTSLEEAVLRRKEGNKGGKSLDILGMVVAPKCGNGKIRK